MKIGNREYPDNLTVRELCSLLEIEGIVIKKNVRKETVKVISAQSILNSIKLEEVKK